MNNLDSLLSRINHLLDDETEPDDLLYPWDDAWDWTANPANEVVEQIEVVENIDIARVLTLANTGRYGELSTAEKLVILDILNHLDAAYPAEDSTPPFEDGDPMPDGAGGRGNLGFRWL